MKTLQLLVSLISSVSCNHNVPTGGGVDYDSGPYTVTFTAGQTIAPFSVPINDDNTLENAETFNVTIIHSSLPDRVTVVDPHEAAVIIGNDDGKQHYIYSVEFLLIN